VDNYVARAKDVPHDKFFTGCDSAAPRGVFVNLVSRIAKNFQDYYLNVVVQKVGTQMYAQSVEHSFFSATPYLKTSAAASFLQKLQKARTDAQAFIASTVNVIFLSLIGIRLY